MNFDTLSPYIRRTWYSTLDAPHHIKTRVLVDYELILITGGEALITIDGVPYHVKKRDAIFIPPGVEHSFLVTEGALIQPHVHFDPIYTEDSPKRKVSFRTYDNMSYDQKALMQENVFADCNIPYVFQPKEYDRFEKYLFEIIEARESNRPYHIILCKSKMLMLLRLILKQFDTSKRHSNNDNDCEIIKDYIDNNYEQIITLDDLERQFGIKKFTLLHKFKKIYGETVISYYNEKRLSLAKRLLLQTEQTVTDISRQLNFTDVYSFSRFFKSKEGVSPKEFRSSDNK